MCALPIFFVRLSAPSAADTLTPVNAFERSPDSLMNHQLGRGAHADARIEDVDATVILRAEPEKLGRGVHACDDGLTG